MKKKSSGDGLIMILPYLVAPIGFAIGHFNGVDWDKNGFFVALIVGACLLVGTIVIGQIAYNILSSFRSEDDDISSNAITIFALALSIVLACLLVQPFKGESAAPYSEKKTKSSYTESSKTSDVASYYQRKYPMVWGYIKKNSSSPYEYIEYYHQVWGRLQAYTGDGINFDTLTRYEQSLVNYPYVGKYIYFANAKTKEYHSTYKCYTLLKSNPVSRDASYAYMYNPCSKCVGD